MEQAPATKKLKLVENVQAELDQSSINPADIDYLSILPNEVLEIIFSHLRPKFLHQNVLPVCKRFRMILTDNKVWMRKIRDHHVKVSLCDAELKNADFSPVRPIHVTLAHPIKGVKLFERSGQKYCLSASDEVINYRKCHQYIQLWDLDAIRFASPLTHEVTFDSTETFGEFAMYGAERFLSSTHGGTLQLWDIGGSGFREIFKKHGVIIRGSISVQDRMLACIGTNNSVFLFDVDNGLQVIGQNVGLPNTGQGSCAISVKLKGNTMYVLFTDQLMTLDMRNLSAGPVHRHVFDLKCILEFPPCKYKYQNMCVADGLIHCFTGGGEISVLQASNLSPCYSFYIGETRGEKVTMSSVVKTKGSVLALNGQYVKAFSLGSQPECIGQADFAPSASVFDVLHEDVLVGSFNGSLTYWPTDNN